MESLRKELCELLEEKSLSSKAHDGTVGPSCSTEIHENGEIGGTDGTTCLPRPRKLRARSSSHDSAYASGDAFKRRASYPRSVVDVRCAKLPRNDTPHGDKPHENRVLDPRCRIVGSESLRTLLQMQNPNVVDAVQFVPTVTVGNAAKSLAELALATPASFSCLVPSDEQSAIQPKSNVVVKRRTGPNIVKVVKPSNKVKPIASVRPLSPKHYVESPVEVVLDADHNHINAPTVVSNSLLPEKKEGAISYHDDENNMETVDAHWVIDRIAQLRLTTDGADHPSISDNENTAGSHSFAENTVSTPSMPSVAIDEHCDQCRIHKSWLIAAMMARVCKRIKINYSSASAGAIPLTHDGWKNLLTFRLSSRAVGRAPCIRCESALSRCLAIFRKSQDLLDLAPENVRPIAKKTHERCVSMDEERMRSTLFDSFAQSSTQSSGHSASLPLENGLHEDQSCAISQKSDHVDNGKEVQRPTNEEVAYHVSPEMDWILAVDARVVLVIASIVIGYRDLILILKESSVLLDALSPEHWNTISLLGVRDQAMKRDEVNAEVITETIRSLSYTTFDVSSLNTNKVLRRDRFQTQAPMYSWIIDSNGSCPVCTLNLKSDVGNKDLSVISFVCGHAYHTICLTRRSSGCLMCRGRMKSANAGRPPHISRM
ncbi:hypothetical protein GCK32_008184 [Trichostrongylus colubriformis]|uniref:RING-type domain-containing protein n=1 Tax=Trichostrongylus colubriformis TaxID=6319 RepID=A0AAN8F9X0_TRICO